MQQKETAMKSPEKETKAGPIEELMTALAAPFDPHEVRFRPGAVSGNRALALPYVDARVIQDRLDDVLGVTGWQDEYECLPEGSVVCRLRLRVGEEWITKMDVGGPSEQPDEGDRRKAAFSDALKRAAVKFGIGRYLYRLPQVWADFDSKKRQFVRTPTLPLSALPAGRPSRVQQVLPGAKVGSPTDAEGHKRTTPSRGGALTSEGKAALSRGTPALPANGIELQRRLYDYDARLARQGLCAAGELVKHVVQAGQQAGNDPDLATWTGPAIQLAVDETRAFEARLRQNEKKPALQESAA